MVKPKRQREWIYIIEPDGTNKIASPIYIRQLLRIDELESSVLALQSRVFKLEKPLRKQRILKILKTEGFRTSNWMRRHIPDFSFEDLCELEREGKVWYKYHGTHKMYGVAEW